jgi:glycosyltransferase involved in cell wall biosynthesis
LEQAFFRLFPRLWEHALGKLIKSVAPSIVHSLEFQHAAYLTLPVIQKERLRSKTPPKWIATNWGSDIYLFGRLAEHRERVRKILGQCDFYSCECERDVRLASDLGLKGQVLPVMPNTGGFDLEHAQALRQTGLVSARRIILLKGYQHWAGRALAGLRALARCANLLKSKGYRVAIYSAGPEVEIAAELFEQETGIETVLIPKSSHDEMLRWYGQARLYIGLSISDAISTSLLEAMVMGAFPIQSCTACADEWIEDGKTGLIVPPEDVDLVEDAIRLVLSDDTLVDTASSLNYQIALARLDKNVMAPKVIDFYKRVYNAKLELKK